MSTVFYHQQPDGFSCPVPIVQSLPIQRSSLMVNISLIGVRSKEICSNQYELHHGHLFDKLSFRTPIWSEFCFQMSLLKIARKFINFWVILLTKNKLMPTKTRTLPPSGGNEQLMKNNFPNAATWMWIIWNGMERGPFACGPEIFLVENTWRPHLLPVIL